MNADAELLLGILAFQNNFVDRPQLLAAFDDWAQQPQRPLGAIFVEQQVLSTAQRELLEALRGEHLKRFNQDVAKSLAALTPVAESARHDLEAHLDRSLHASLAQLGADRTGEVPLTAPYSVGQSTSDGARFRILRAHAKGGLGEVYVAADEELHREVALKQIQSCHADHPDSRSRFLREAEITGGLEHPGIVPIYGLGCYANGRPYYAMRFIRGETLHAAIKRFHDSNRQLSETERSLEFRRLLQQLVNVCNAVDYAHSRGVLHRDLKPGNIMLGKYGETLVVDWGLAQYVGNQELYPDSDEHPLKLTSESSSAPTQYGMAIGTPRYMSPEQGAGELDKIGLASDVYSLGATLYELITGRPPAVANDAGEALPLTGIGAASTLDGAKLRIAPSLSAIAMRALAFEPQCRFQSARMLADAIEGWLASSPFSMFEKDVEQAKALALAHPDDATCLDKLGRASLLFGTVLFGVGRAQDAAAMIQMGIDTLENSAKKASAADYRRFEELGEAYLSLARAHRIAGSDGAAYEAHCKAWAYYHKLRDIKPDSPAIQSRADDLYGSVLKYRPTTIAEDQSLPIMEDQSLEELLAHFTAHIDQVSVRYSDLRPIAQGGLGEVLLVRDSVLGREVAKKRIAGGDPAAIARFVVEWRLAGALQHPGIVPVYDFGREPDGSYFITMPLVTGETLKEKLRYGVTLSGNAYRRYLLSVVPVFVQACRAVAFAHKCGIVHLNLKSSKIMVTRDLHAYVIDWGFGRFIGSDDSTIADDLRRMLEVSDDASVGMLLGTPPYMAPEQMRGRKASDGRSDVFALGGTLFEMLTGTAPRAGMSLDDILSMLSSGKEDGHRPRAIRGDVPKTLDGICFRATRRERDLRYDSVDEFVSDLEEWMSSASSPMSKVLATFGAVFRRSR